MDITADCQQLQRGIESSLSQFQQHADVNRLLLQMRALVLCFVETLVVACIRQRFQDKGFLDAIKALAAKSALRYKGFKTTGIRLLTGRSLAIESPYFAKAAPSSRRGPKSKRRAPKSGCHAGLAFLGFLDRSSAVLASPAVQAALLCPSFQVAKTSLASLGIALGTKTIKRLCRHMGERAMQSRTGIALSQRDTAAKRSLLVCIDGGRLRERRAKRGRRPEHLKRQGYHTDWREPTQLVLQWLNADGSRCQDIAPIYDATMTDTDGAFDLLQDYLQRLDARNADTVIFCADGARKYWTRFGALAKKLQLKPHFEVVDYTHAKQNLNEIIGHLPAKLSPVKKKAVAEHFKELLWRGDIDALGEQIRLHITGAKQRKRALTKFRNYFLGNSRRMKYASFKHLDLPSGSGCVESAIRRVINLRLKSPGIFWKKETAETMLFLRSTLLCGRWKYMLNNLLALNRGELADCH